MKNTKLIIVTGISGSGKSTTSKNIAKQYQMNGIEHFWLHEEISKHPIRDNEFSIGSVYSEEDMDKNVVDMYSRWRKLVNTILQSDSVYIMEGCLYQNIIRYFFSCNYPIEKITQFYDTVMDICQPLNPTIVFLYRSDIKRSFSEAFNIRGERWKNIILEPEKEGYFSQHPYEGEDSIYLQWEHYQEIANTMFERYKGNKIKVNTSNGLWDEYIKDISNYLGLVYKKDEIVTIDDLEKYCGKYVIQMEGYQSTLEIKIENNELHCQTFWWKNMKLIPIGNHEFDFLSFPIKLHFQFHNDKKAVRVLGIYDWDINGKVLYAI